MSDADKKWIPGSDDQFWYWNWCIQNNIELNLGYIVHSIVGTPKNYMLRTEKYSTSSAPSGYDHHRLPTINGMGPFDINLNRLVKSLKAAA